MVALGQSDNALFLLPGRGARAGAAAAFVGECRRRVLGGSGFEAQHVASAEAPMLGSLGHSEPGLCELFQDLHAWGSLRFQEKVPHE